MDMEEFAAYQAWANSITLEVLRDAHHAEANSTFAHMLAANLVWGNRLAGKTPDCTVRPSWDLNTCEEMITRITALYQNLPGKLSNETVVEYTTSTGSTYSSSVAQIMKQLWVHNAYHRGEIAGYIRNSGGTVPDTDYIIFARTVR